MKPKLHYLMAGLLLSFSPLAAAEIYIGGAFGSTHPDIDGFNDSDTHKVFGGIRERHLGLEVGYIGFDDFFVTGSGGSQSINGDGLEASVVGFLPFGQRTELFGKLGVLNWSLDGNSGGSTFRSDDGSSLAYGAGVQIFPLDELALRFEYQGFQDVSGSDLSTISIGASLHF